MIYVFIADELKKVFHGRLKQNKSLLKFFISWFVEHSGYLSDPYN